MVEKNTAHSMARDKIDGGSFRKPLRIRCHQQKIRAINSKNLSTIPPAQIVILDARKSKNTVIVLKSLSISRSELLDALTNGHGLNADTLEKLIRIAPTKEESHPTKEDESQILEFSGNPTRLAVSESFLFYLLKAVPSAFEILDVKETRQIVYSGCKELRNRGLFIKLLEAILKAGNAQAFKLTSLRKQSDVKSISGKTTSLRRGASKEKREKEYLMPGLPAVGGLSADFLHCKENAIKHAILA
ncbi:hypothetical protein SADUNF_Sadunf08G0158300 [Salix dunnii]|uniref:FH2 domain-containing protein n=1 Tax=Salix dunnii TaxID=1413687 RepID=A0A835JXL9_9ROSI|nr:hypothetical protein SADUNF_Sadunf08G0158300 [Salix dunnii]